ncbi:Mannose-6-phosphate isomerase, cupin superfamily [Natronincola peptidivorans]|uniref:Mannose-6-phosphate isomerase, cupin superfamily n=1 Tax=Natronincola peptidivorans TaxID=426128 RepID=A0A1I0DT52_9FIRM|nr:cupin domain-containing protein [Natronincola peptidivorans]SET34984.1 Mannose-6-phosphate isomerase, cupin superfamily [Natronincola peptidivorans]
MYNDYRPYPYPASPNTPMYNPYNMYNGYRMYPYPYWGTPPTYPSYPPKQPIKLKDYGPCPYVVNIEEATTQNDYYRIALWTGEYLQLTLMSINSGDDIGLEIHEDHDQFIRIEEGQGMVMMGDKKDQLDFRAEVYDDYAIFIPAGKWHNLINTGCTPLKLYSIYAPPEHPHGTLHRTKADAEKHY